MKLSAIAHTYLGLNSQEIRKFSQDDVYSSDDLNKDLSLGGKDANRPHKEKYKVYAGDVVMHLMSNQAAVVSQKSDGKIISQRIMKLDIDPRKVNNWYLCYLLNESNTIKHQAFQAMEGSILRHLAISNIRDFSIELPPLQRQKEIGEMYRKYLINERLLEVKKQLIRKSDLNVLNKMNNDKENENG